MTKRRTISSYHEVHLLTCSKYQPAVSVFTSCGYKEWIKGPLHTCRLDYDNVALTILPFDCWGLVSCRKHDKYSTNMHKLEIVCRHIHNMSMHSLLKPTVVFLPEHTHTRKCAHILTHMQPNSSCSSCGWAPSPVMSSYVWSFSARSFTAGAEKNSKTELMCVFVLRGRGEPFFSWSTNRKTLAAFSQDRGRQWQRERSQSDIDLNQTNPPLVPMWP